MIQPAHIVAGGVVATVAFLGLAAPGLAQPAPSPDPMVSEQNCQVLLGTASGETQSCSVALGGGLIGSYYLHQDRSPDGKRLVMTCTIFGGVGADDPNQSCHYTLLGGLIRGGQ